MAGQTIREIELGAVARISALDGSAFDQGATKGVWTEATIPLAVEDESHPLGHLAYNVWVESARNLGLERDGAHTFARMASDVVVFFTFHIRPTQQIEDARLASDAALQVISTLMALPQNLSVFQLVNAFRPALAPDGEWMLVRLDFIALHDLPL